MIDLNALISQTFGTIESVIPDAIIYGELVKLEKVYDRNTATYITSITERQSVKCVFDHIEESFRIAENSDSIISKIHVFGLLPKPVELFDELILTMDGLETTYKTEQLRKINVGESSVLHTFIITR